MLGFGKGGGFDDVPGGVAAGCIPYGVIVFDGIVPWMKKDQLEYFVHSYTKKYL